MIAPKSVEFFSRDGHALGDKRSLEARLARISSVPGVALQGASLSLFSPQEKMTWAENRQTTRIEDKAYCLFGIFNVFLPPMYGEGENAMVRLRKEVKDRHDVWADSGSSAIPIAAGPSGERRRYLMATLAFEQMDSRHLSIKVAQQKTCDWFVQHPMYVAWSGQCKAEEQQDILWLSGKPGTGKSTLVKYALSHAQKAKSQGDMLIAFFFNARGDELEKSTMGMYRSLLHQLLSDVHELQKVLDGFVSFLSGHQKEITWTLDALQVMLTSAIMGLGSRRVTCFIDALDECDEQEIRSMFDFFDDLGEKLHEHETQLLVCFASRHYPTIEIHNGQRMILEDEVGHGLDLQRYIQKHFRAGKSLFATEIQQQILEKANGVFLWVVLVVDILNKEFSRGRIFAVKKRLQEIPEKLTELFKDILRRDNVNMDDFLLCLQWILFAKRPLRMEEFYFAMEAGLHSSVDGLEHAWKPEPWSREKITTEDMHRFVLSSSKGLAELTKGQPTVQFIHESVRDFLIRDNGMVDLWPELAEDLISSWPHERLKHCCQSCLSIIIPEVTVTESSPPALSQRKDRKRWTKETEKEKWSKRRSTLVDSYPFLEYASEYILCHADEAARNISQDTFLADFALGRWIEVSNAVEPHEIRRHGHGVNLEYILAEQGCSRLLLITAAHGLGAPCPTERYRYPLIAAFSNGHRGTVEALLKAPHDAYVEGIVKDPGSGKASQFRPADDALSWAVRNGNKSVCRWLLEHYFEFFRPGSHEGLLAAVAAHGWTTIVEVLLGRGYSAKDTMSVRQSFIKVRPCYAAFGDNSHALHNAARGGHCKMARVLLDRGASINKLACVRNGGTPLHWAVAARQMAMVQLLVKKRAGIDIRDRSGSPPLHAAVQIPVPRHLESVEDRPLDFGPDIAQILIDAGADIEARDDNNGFTALHRASCSHDCLDSVRFLLDRDADIRAVDYIGKDSLYFAFARSSAEVVDLLLAKGGSIHPKVHGAVALFFAIRNARLHMAQQLLDDGVDANSSWPTYLMDRKPLVRASDAIVELLISRGVQMTDLAKKFGVTNEKTTQIPAGNPTIHETFDHNDRWEKTCTKPDQPHLLPGPEMHGNPKNTELNDFVGPFEWSLWPGNAQSLQVVSL